MILLRAPGSFGPRPSLPAGTPTPPASQTLWSVS